MPDGVQQFYDALADSYHLIFEEWDRAIARQAGVLEAVIKARYGRSPFQLHDCACGIGTQAIGLAALGHQVSGSDLSGAAVRRAAEEAAMRELHVPFAVADMTDLAQYASDSFEVLGAFDNALPHLSVRQLEAAASTFRRVLRKGGIFIASVRDYDELVTTRPAFQAPSFYGSPGERRIVHQVWDWTGMDAYDVHQYISLEREHDWHVLHFSSNYRCLLRAELTEQLLNAGFNDVEWLTPAVTGYYQPIVLARAP